MADFVEQKIQADVLDKIEVALSDIGPDTHEATDELLKLLAANEGWIDPSRMSSYLRQIRKLTGITMEWLKGGIRKHRRERTKTGPIRLITSDNGTPLPLEANVIALMRSHKDLVGLFALDEFHQKSVVTRKAPWDEEEADQYPRDATDADLVELLLWMQHHDVYLKGLTPIKSAMVAVIQDSKFHPVREYHASLVWDGVPRLPDMLHRYFGVAPIPGYTDKVGLKWMVSAVARITDPGCMAKYVLVLLGPQDLGKSTAFQVLAGDWFTDDIAQLGTKDSSQQVGNAWIVELAELDSTARAEQSAIKAFISRSVDRFRPPYGAHIVEQKRQCVLCATVNPNGKIFKDETGAVRFWGVTCTKIDLDGLRRDRDQLWAEAVERHRAGEAWWFTPGEEESLAVVREQQAEHSETIEDHPWTELIKAWIDEQEREVAEVIQKYRQWDGHFDWGDVAEEVDVGDARCRVRRQDGTLVFQIYEVMEVLSIERQNMNNGSIWRQATKILMGLGWKSAATDRACCPLGEKERVRRWQRAEMKNVWEAQEAAHQREPGEDEDEGAGMPWEGA